jgi:hypothetical protein
MAPRIVSYEPLEVLAEYARLLSKLRLTAYEEKNLSRLGETLVDQAPHSHYKSGTKRTEARERDDGLKKFSLCGCGAV